MERGEDCRRGCFGNANVPASAQTCIESYRVDRSRFSLGLPWNIICKEKGVGAECRKDSQIRLPQHEVRGF